MKNSKNQIFENAQSENRTTEIRRSQGPSTSPKNALETIYSKILKSESKSGFF